MVSAVPGWFQEGFLESLKVQFLADLKGDSEDSLLTFALLAQLVEHKILDLGVARSKLAEGLA